MKKFFVIAAICAVSTLSLSAFASYPEKFSPNPPGKRINGDLNCSGRVTATDALIALQISTGLLMETAGDYCY